MSAVSPVASASGTTAAGVYYEVYGTTGPELFLGFPVTSSPLGSGSPDAAPVLGRFLAGLAGLYRVLVADYPSVGRSATVPPAELTIQRVCADLWAVADAAGFSRFAWWGGTFGAIAGLHLAAGSDRISALISAGWPPLGGPYATMLRGARLNAPDPPAHARAILRDPAQYAQWITFYESLAEWPESTAVAAIACPRLVVYGANAESDVAGLPLALAATIRERNGELLSLGWQVVEVPDGDAGLILDPETLVPVVRRFLDAVLLN